MYDAESPTLENPTVLSVEALRRIIGAVEPKALLVDPWIMRRVIRLDRRLTGLSFHVPHRQVYTIERDRLLAYVDRPELDLAPATELPPVVILLAKPTEEETLDPSATTDVLRRYWRLLFHARVHLELDHRYPNRQPPRFLPEQRRRQLGELEFAEIRSVLSYEDLLFPDPTDWETYVEFAAFYLELRYFQPEDLETYFPTIRDWDMVGRVVGQDVYHAELFEAVRLIDAEPTAAGRPPAEESNPPSEETDGQPRRAAPEGISTPRAIRWRGKALRAEAMGNVVRAAIYWQRAADVATPAHRDTNLRAAARQIKRLVHRLRDVLRLTDAEEVEWAQALQLVLPRAARGIWSSDARLLLNLQKVCLEHESTPLRLNLLQWIRSGFRVPLRHPLPLLREVLLTKHLRSAERRLVQLQMSAVERATISRLFSTAVHHLEHDLRRTMRPLISQVLNEVGLRASNLPERVAHDKLVEELLDHLVEHGYINTSIFRDALSKGDLKLPDVSGPWELWRGDMLLRADRRLAQVLDGVYRPAAIYLRWSQRLSSVAFGTPAGRFITKYIALPYGGAYLTIEGIQHMLGWFTADHGVTIPENVADVLEREAAAVAAAAAHAQVARWEFFGAVALLGTFILLLIHHRGFRAWCIQALGQAGRLARRVLVDWPMSVLRIPIVQQILHSPAYATFRSYALKPALLTALLWAVLFQFFETWSGRTSFEVFLVLSLFLNSPIGRYADEWLTDIIIRSWEELRVRVFAAFLQWVMDIFHRLMMGLDRLMFALDEWSRFRARDSSLLKLFKLIGGGVWSVVSYFVVLVSTLLIEPQINPIKHFPVVTVSHKLILPMGPMLIKQLAPYIGLAEANILVLSTIWLIPGVFGFLVWELKENWRLYAANRPQLLRPLPIGHHGETMVALLRTGFHQGTVPRRFARLRRAMRKARATDDWKGVNRQLAPLAAVEVAVKRYVDRDLLGPVRLVDSSPLDALEVADVRLATNRIEVSLRWSGRPESPLRILWEELDGQLTCRVYHERLLQRLPPHAADALALSLTGMFQRTGVDAADSEIGALAEPPLTWRDWVQAWTELESSARPLEVVGQAR